MPARAPASIAMLQTVMRPSMRSARIGGAGELDRVAGAAGGADLADDRQHDVLRAAARAELALDRAPAGSSPCFASSVCVASTCSTSLVPMPSASAPNAPWVEVCESPQTTVMPGSVAPCSGPITWTMPWRRSFILNCVMPSRSQLASSVSTCRREIGSAMPCDRSVVGTLWSLTARLADRRQTLRPASVEPLEGLRARHLVDQMPVDVEQGRAVVFGVDDVFVPDLVVQRAEHGHGRARRRRPQSKR